MRLVLCQPVYKSQLKAMCTYTSKRVDRVENKPHYTLGDFAVVLRLYHPP